MRLEHGDAAHLADPLVVPVGQPLHHSAVRHHDSQPYIKTARTPPVHTFPLSRSGMSRELKILMRSAPKAWGAFLSRASTAPFPDAHALMYGTFLYPTGHWCKLVVGE